MPYKVTNISNQVISINDPSTSSDDIHLAPRGTKYTNFRPSIPNELKSYVLLTYVNADGSEVPGDTIVPSAVFSPDQLQYIQEQAGDIEGLSATITANVLSETESFLSDDLGASKIGVLGGNNLQDIVGPLSVSPVGNMFLGSFFRSNEDPSIVLMASQNSIHWQECIGSMSTNGQPFIGRDPSLMFKNGEFFVAVTDYGVDSYDCVVWRSRDLYQWTKHQVRLGSVSAVSATRTAPGGSVPCDRLWAPEWFEAANGDVYLLVSLKYTANELDNAGSSIPSFRPYYSRCTDLDTLSFEAPIQFNCPAGNKIDPAIINRTSDMVMAIKNEFSKQIEFYSSTTLSGTWTLLSTLTGDPAEGPCIIQMDSNTFRVFFDLYSQQTTAYVDTTNFTTFSVPNYIETGGKHRHGTVVSFRNSSPNDRNFIRSRVASVVGAPRRTNEVVGQRNLVAGANAIRPKTGMIYAVTGSIAATLNITAPTAEWFYIRIASKAAGASITLPNSTFYYAIDGNSDVFSPLQGADRLIEIRQLSAGGQYLAVGVGRATGTSGSLVSAAGGATTITSANFTPRVGWTYTTSGSDAAEISVDTIAAQPIGAWFNLLIGSGSQNGSIRLKSTAASLGGRDVLFRGDFGWDGVAIRLEFSGAAWRLCAPGEVSTVVAVASDPVAAGATKTVTVPLVGARATDSLDVAYTVDTGALLLKSRVTANDSVEVQFVNLTAASITLAAGSLRVRARR